MDFMEWCEIIDLTITSRLGARFVEQTRSSPDEWGWRYGTNTAAIVLQRPSGTDAKVLINGKEQSTFSLLEKPQWIGETIAGWLAGTVAS